MAALNREKALSLCRAIMLRSAYGPAPTPADPGDHLDPAELVGLRTIRTTSVMGCRASSPPSVHLATGVMLPSVVGTRAATPSGFTHENARVDQLAVR